MILTATWKTTGNGPANSVASCVGPGVLTVTQTKVFQQSGGLAF